MLSFRMLTLHFLSAKVLSIEHNPYDTVYKINYFLVYGFRAFLHTSIFQIY